MPLFLKVSLTPIPSNNINTNLDSRKYMCDLCGSCYDQRQGHETGLVVLLLPYCAGESLVGILLVPSSLVFWGGFWVWDLLVVGRVAGFFSFKVMNG